VKRHHTSLALSVSLAAFVALLSLPIFAEGAKQNCLALLVFVSLLWCTEVRGVWAIRCPQDYCPALRPPTQTAPTSCCPAPCNLSLAAALQHGCSTCWQGQAMPPRPTLGPAASCAHAAHLAPWRPLPQPQAHNARLINLP
jgi:hypothetical protein